MTIYNDRLYFNYYINTTALLPKYLEFAMVLIAKK